MRRMLLAAIIASSLAARPVHAFDASGADIIGLRLGMSDSEITTRLAAQGFGVTSSADACTDQGQCVVTIKASTRDGALVITLSSDAGASEIRYSLLGHGAGEPEKIRAAMNDHFGRPNQQKPMVWCRGVSGNGACPRDQASLTFLPDTSTVILKSGATDRR